MAFGLQLTRLELTNFHKFEHYSIDFDDHMTVLVGDNGAGKSSILAAARIALGTFLFHIDFSQQKLLSNSDARIARYSLGDVTDLQEQFPVTVSATGLVGEPQEQMQWSRSLESADGDTTTSQAREMLSISHECTERIKNGDAQLVLPVIAHYGTNRLYNKLQNQNAISQNSPKRQDGYRGALDAQANQDLMLSWFFKMTVQDFQRTHSLDKKEPSPLFAAVRSAVEQCFRLITGCSRVQVTYNLDTNDLDIEYEDPDEGIKQLPMSLLSDGYRSTLSMFADIACRMAILNPGLKEHVLTTSGVVLIDEVDLHLHPLWQARILGDLREIFPNVQFIVTTHAPVVISSVHSRHIRILADGDSATQPSSEIYGSDVGRALISVMGAPERPVAIQNKFDEFYDMLDRGDLSGAKEKLNSLENTLGSDDTDLVGAHTALSLEEADLRYASHQ